MNEAPLETALARAEQALARIEAAVRRQGEDRRRDELLRSRVREAIAELDELITTADA